MTDSKSTDKLVALSHLLDKMIDKIGAEKVHKIKTLEITWKVEDTDGERLTCMLPELKLEFHP